MRRRSIPAASALFFGLAVTAALAAGKPDFAIKSKLVDASVELDDTIRANPALAANLLAEGKAWVQKSAAEAKAESKSSPEMFRGGNGWSYERNYTTDSVVANRYVSIVRTDFTYTGGAHPNTSFNTILWDSTAKKRISIRSFFKETDDGGPMLTATLKAVIESLKAEKKERGMDEPGDEWAKSLEPKLLKIGPITLAPSTEKGKSAGLNFHYSAYDIGAYAEGPYDGFVSWTVLKPFLTPEGEAIFGGERTESASDADKPKK